MGEFTVVALATFVIGFDLVYAWFGFEPKRTVGLNKKNISPIKCNEVRRYSVGSEDRNYANFNRLATRWLRAMEA